jgi:hypothetical protein
MEDRVNAIRTFAVVLTTAAVALLALPSPAHAGDPSSNTSPSGLYQCDINSSTITDNCLAGALQDFNRARAKEHLYGLLLPTNFRYLPVTYQVFILANIDRADRGLPQFTGLSKTLNPYALQGARTNSDPPFPSWTTYGAGNWAGTVNSLWAEYEWVYDDGYGSSNLDCGSPSAPGCWGHRHNVVMNWPGPMIMGAATANNGVATIVLGRDTHDKADQFLWSSEFKYFNKRVQPKISISGGVGVLNVAITHESRTTLVVQRYYSGAWHSVGHPVTGGTTLNGATWKRGFSMPRGTYRVAALENSRFLKAWSNQTVVR